MISLVPLLGTGERLVCVIEKHSWSVEESPNIYTDGRNRQEEMNSGVMEAGELAELTGE
jgi:hypothetical protein